MHAEGRERASQTLVLQAAHRAVCGGTAGGGRQAVAGSLPTLLPPPLPRRRRPSSSLSRFFSPISAPIDGAPRRVGLRRAHFTTPRLGG